MSHLWGFVDGSHFRSDAQGDVCVLRVSAVQVPHPLTARLPPEVQEAVSNGVVLKHDVVYMSVFLGGERKTTFTYTVWYSGLLFGFFRHGSSFFEDVEAAGQEESAC